MIRASVVVPTFRRPDLLARCLAALAGQDFDPSAFEVLVADDSAGVGTRRQVEAFVSRAAMAVRYVAVTGPHGPAAARNRTPAGAILSRLMDDVDVVQALVTGQTLSILADLGTTAAIAGLFLARGPRLALAVGLVMIGYAAAFRIFTHRIRSASLEIRERLDGVFGHLKERFDGALVVRAYARRGRDRRLLRADRRCARAPGPGRAAGRGVLERGRGARGHRLGPGIRRRGV